MLGFAALTPTYTDSNFAAECWGSLCSPQPTLTVTVGRALPAVASFGDAAVRGAHPTGFARAPDDIQCIFVVIPWPSGPKVSLRAAADKGGDGECPSGAYPSRFKTGCGQVADPASIEES